MFRNIFYGAYCTFVLFCEVGAMYVERTQETKNVHVVDVHVDSDGEFVTSTSTDTAFTQAIDNDPYGELITSTLTGAVFMQEIGNDPYGEYVVSALTGGPFTQGND